MRSSEYFPLISEFGNTANVKSPLNSKATCNRFQQINELFLFKIPSLFLLLVRVLSKKSCLVGWILSPPSPLPASSNQWTLYCWPIWFLWLDHALYFCSMTYALSQLGNLKMLKCIHVLGYFRYGIQSMSFHFQVHIILLPICPLCLQHPYNRDPCPSLCSI